MMDGTMIYVPKSGQFHFQKREYNKYKARNCLIFMPIVATNGRYVICLGPYNSDKYQNDAAIYTAATDMDYIDWCSSNPFENSTYDEYTLDKLLHLNNNLFTSNDRMIADRGFWID